MKIYTLILLLFTLSCGEVKPVATKLSRVKTEKKLEKDEIKLRKTQSNVFEVEVELNGALKIPCLLDTGCSAVSLPPYIVYTLIKIGTIKKEDYLPSQNYIIANGDIITNARFILRELKIGNYVLKNVECSMSNNELAPILLGQNVLNKFKKVTIDYKKEVLILEK